jgi:hypothetical protein
MMRVDKKVAKVNDRVSDVISRFEAYINEENIARHTGIVTKRD